ncbi:hypothetical protein ACHQM5_015146 [Ranunculus cassubicifolius]
MSILSPSPKLIFLFSISISISLSNSSPSPRIPKASASDLLSLLSTKQQSSTINPYVSKELKSCLKFLVPFSPNSSDKYSIRKKDLLNRREIAENELIWWPPSPVLELARIAVDSGGDPGAIHRTLDPTVLMVPDVEGSNEERCQLTRSPYGRQFINEEVNTYLAFLFELIAARGPAVGLNVSLNRFDFFHGHLFLATNSGRMGILFHAKEYPAFDKDVFPHNMGYCQRGSNVAYDDMMNLRNILWLAPLPSNSSKAWIAPDLVAESQDVVRTIYEALTYLCICSYDLGYVVVEPNYLNPIPAVADHKIFIC